MICFPQPFAEIVRVSALRKDFAEIVRVSDFLKDFAEIVRVLRAPENNHPTEKIPFQVTLAKNKSACFIDDSLAFNGGFSLS